MVSLYIMALFFGCEDLSACVCETDNGENYIYVLEAAVKFHCVPKPLIHSHHSAGDVIGR